MDLRRAQSPDVRTTQCGLRWWIRSSTGAGATTGGQKSLDDATARQEGGTYQRVYF